MTEETLKYMAVQPVAVVLLLRNCLWNELKFGKMYKIKNIEVQHLLTHSLLMSFQKRWVGFDMFLLFSIFPHLYNLLSQLCNFTDSSDLWIDVVCRSPLGLDCFCPAEYGTVLETTCADCDYESPQQLRRKLWKLYFVWQFMCQRLSYKFP